MEWKTVSICDLCKSITETYKGSAHSVVLINTSDVLEGKCLNHARTKNINIKGQFKKTFRKEDILYSEIRPANKRFAYIDFNPVDYIASTKLMVLRANEFVDSRFLYQILRSDMVLEQLQMLAESRSGTFPQITYSEMANVLVNIPPIEIQKKIASILSSLDDQIENNNRINRNLEEQAQALFKSWFVDFEPWGGVMPDDWEEGCLGDLITEIESGSRPKGGAETKGIPSVGAEKIEKFGEYNYQAEKYVNENYFNNMRRGHVKDGDVLLYKDGAYTGKVSMSLDGFPYKKMAVNEHVFILRTQESKFQNYLYIFMSQNDIKEMIYRRASSKAAQPGLNTGELLSVETIVPNMAIINKYNETIKPLMHSIANNALTNRRLAQLRDTLLPKLMNGEIEL